MSVEAENPSLRGRAERAFEDFLDQSESSAIPAEEFIARQPEELREELRRILEDYHALRNTLGDGMARIAAGQVLDDYLLLNEIGYGNYGAVWEAEQISLGKRVALKILYPQYSLSTQALTRFRREARVGGQLQHQGIVTVYAVGQYEGIHYIAQELVPNGFTIQDYVNDAREKSVLPADYFQCIAEMFARIADALQEAHDHGVIHRDIKPANILLLDDTQPKVADFGMAKLVDAHALSGSGDRTGTPRYMSPEQTGRKTKRLDHRTDVFSLGSTLYEALTFRFAFEGDSWQQLLDRIQHTDPPHPQSIRSKVPEDLAVISMKALEKNADRRYQTMTELAADLRRFLADEPILAKPPGLYNRTAKWARRHPVLSVSAAILCVALCVVTFLLFQVVDERDKAKKLATKLATEEARSSAEAERARAQSYKAYIIASDTDLRVNEIESAGRHLEQCPPKYRGWEWLHLKLRADASIAQLARPGGIGHREAEFHGDGKRILVLTDEDTLEWHDAWTGDLLGTIDDVIGHPLAIGVRSRSFRILSELGGKLVLWDPETRGFRAPLQVSGVRLHAFSEGGGWLAVHTDRNEIQVFNTTTGARARSIESRPLSALAVSRDGKRLAAVDADRQILLWLPGKSEPTVIGRCKETLIPIIRFSPNQSLLAVKTQRNEVTLWRRVLQAGGRSTEWKSLPLSGHTQPVTDIAFDPASRVVATSSIDNTIRAWDVATGKTVMVFRGHVDGPRSVAFSRDGGRLVTLGRNTSRLWHLYASDNHVLPSSIGYQSAIFSADGKSILAGDENGTIHLLDPATGARTRLAYGHRNIVNILKHDHRRKRIVSASYDGTIRIWRSSDMELEREIEAHAGAVEAVAWSPDDKQLVSAGGMGEEVKVWDVESGELVRTLPLRNLVVRSLAVSPSDGTVAIGGLTGEIRLFSLAGEPLGLIHAHGAVGVLALQFTPDGERLISSAEDRRVVIWKRPATGWGAVPNMSVDELRAGELVGQKRSVKWMTMVPGRPRLLTVALDGTFRISDIESADQIYVERRFNRALVSADFDPSGRRLLTLSSTRVIRVFETKFDREGAEARRRMTPRQRAERPIGETHGLPDFQNAEDFEQFLLDPRLTAILRGFASTFIGGSRVTTPQTLNMRSWALARRDDRDQSEYERAVQLARRATTLEPGNIDYQRTLGVAQYRASAYREAAATLERVDEARRRSPTPVEPVTLAFLAMAYKKSGRTEKARLCMDRLTLIRQQLRPGDRDARQWYKEVDAVFQQN